MYIDPHTMSEEEKIKMKRQLSMQQMSYQSDLKKIEREQNDLRNERRRLDQERSRMDVYIKENEEKVKKNNEKETYLNDELQRLKKRLIELG